MADVQLGWAAPQLNHRHDEPEEGPSGNDEQAQAVIDWVNGAPLGELAAELMAAFAPRAAGRQATGVYLNHLGAWLFRGYTRPQRHAADVVTPVREAVQLLEHAELVYLGTTGSGTVE